MPREANQIVTIVFDLDETLCNNRYLSPPIIRPGAFSLLKGIRDLYPSPKYKPNIVSQRKPSLSYYGAGNTSRNSISGNNNSLSSNQVNTNSVNRVSTQRLNSKT